MPGLIAIPEKHMTGRFFRLWVSSYVNGMHASWVIVREISGFMGRLKRSATAIRSHRESICIFFVERINVPTILNAHPRFSIRDSLSNFAMLLRLIEGVKGASDDCFRHTIQYTLASRDVT
jgi:hypothetical protein